MFRENIIAYTEFPRTNYLSKIWKVAKKKKKKKIHWDFISKSYRVDMGIDKSPAYL